MAVPETDQEVPYYRQLSGAESNPPWNQGMKLTGTAGWKRLKTKV